MELEESQLISDYVEVQEELNDRLCGMSDEGLVLAAQAGNDAAFSELWRRHSRMIHRVLFRLTGNREDAEDAQQEAFLKAFASLKHFESRAKFSTWLTRIAINSGLMVLRSRRRRPMLSLDSPLECESWSQQALVDRRQDIEDSYIWAERVAIIDSALHQIKPTSAMIIRHQISHDCSIAETAECHGISVAAAKSRLIRGKSALRSTLEKRRI